MSFYSYSEVLDVHPQDLALIGLRVVAVYLAVLGLGGIASLGNLLLSNPMTTPYGSVFLGALAMLTPAAIAVLLWAFAPRLAVMATRECSEQNVEGRLTVHDLTSCGLIVVGAFLFASACPRLVAQLLILGSEEYNMAASWIVSEGLTCVLAIALMVGAKPIAHAALKLRGAGLSQ